MAKKRSTTQDATAAPKRAGTKKAGTAKKSAKAGAKAKAGKAGAKAAAKKAALVKLNDKQAQLLQKVKSAAAETGYVPENAGEQRSLEALQNKKLVKKGKKNKETGRVPYMITKTGEKHLGSSQETPAPDA